MYLILRKVIFTAANAVCISLLFFTELDAQNFSIRTITTREGLSHNHVREIALDSTGFLWVATWDGLCRYNGYSFKNYYYRAEDSLSIPYFSISRVLVDGDNNLWIFTDHGDVARYNRYDDTFNRIGQLNENQPETYLNIDVDESGYLWLINPGRLTRYNFISDKYENYDILNNNDQPDMTGRSTVSVIDRNRLWVVGEKIYEFEIRPENELFMIKRYSLDSKYTLKGLDFDYSNWYRIIFSESGRKWINSSSGLYLLDEASGIFRKFNGEIPAGEFTGNGFICWSETNKGLYIFDKGKNKLALVPYDYPQLLTCVLCQNSDLVWFSGVSVRGAATGLNQVVFIPEYFKSYSIPSETKETPVVYAITKDRFNRLWIGQRGKYGVVQITPGKESEILKIPYYKTNYEPGAVRSLTVTSDGIWIGYFREILIYYDFITGQFARHTPEAGFFRPVAINEKGLLFLPGDQGYLNIYNPELRKTEASINFKTASPIYKIVIDDNNIVWAGSNQCALVSIDPSKNKSETFYLSKENFNIEDICIGDNGDLWLALLGGGVCRFNQATGEKTFYTTSNGLANNITYCILRDRNGNVWVSTNTGISRINPSTGIIRSFGMSEGLTINEFNSGASFRDEDGQFFMGGMGGIVSFDPDKINEDETKKVTQKLIIDEIMVSGEKKPFMRSLKSSDTVILKKGEDNFKVYFSSSDFVHSNNTLYRYRLSGLNRDWTETDSRNRSISYANLDPGWYNFQLQATDLNGSWNASKEINIRIQPFYYETRLFRIGIPSLIVLLITSVIVIYIRQIKQRSAQKLDALRLQSLQGQMNPHFIFNSLNSINYFISKNDALSANRYIADFSKLIRSILYNFNSDFILLEKEIESIEEYLKIEHLRFGDKFNYRVNVDPRILPGQIKVSPGLVQPFVENAIWHGVRGLEGRKCEVNVSFDKKSDQLVCTIEDNGVGRKNSSGTKGLNAEKESRGISIVTDRLKIINNLYKSNYRVVISDLYPDRKETGTRIVIDIPVKNN